MFDFKGVFIICTRKYFDEMLEKFGHKKIQPCEGSLEEFRNIMASKKELHQMKRGVI